MRWIIGFFIVAVITASLSASNGKQRALSLQDRIDDLEARVAFLERRQKPFEFSDWLTEHGRLPGGMSVKQWEEFLGRKLTKEELRSFPK